MRYRWTAYYYYSMEGSMSEGLEETVTLYKTRQRGRAYNAITHVTSSNENIHKRLSTVVTTPNHYSSHFIIFHSRKKIEENDHSLI